MNTAALNRRLENLIRFGTIAEVDPLAPRCRVKTGGLITGWLPFFAARAGEDAEWDPPSIGEQCMVFSPSGDPATGAVLPGLYSDRFKAPDTSLARHRRTYRDGAVIDYDTSTHTLKAILPAGGKVEVIADGGLHIVGSITHEGDYTQTGNQAVTGSVAVSGGIAADGDIVGGGISLTTHTHSGVQAGPSSTGGPQ